MRIKIEKVAEVQTGLPANPKAAHVDGQVQNENFSLPLEYTIEGELVGQIAVGNGVLVARDTRNGVKADGMFTTSVVTEVTEKQFRTRNSVYNYSVLTT
jgi:hypothetical protein